MSARKPPHLRIVTVPVGPFVMNSREEVMQAVADVFCLHELAVEDAVHAHQRPKLERYDKTLFLVLKTVNYVEHASVSSRPNPKKSDQRGNRSFYSRARVLVNETAGSDWLDPDRFRIGASSLLNDLLLQRRRMEIGAYASADHLTLG